MALFVILTTRHARLLSAYGADDLSVGGEAAGRFFGIRTRISNTPPPERSSVTCASGRFSLIMLAASRARGS
jgi:hypothetical protein